MGIIKRQSIKSTIVNYVGVIVGALAIFFVYPLNKDIYGYAQFLYNTASLLIPLGTLGALSIIVRYFPKFNVESSSNYNGFLSLVLLVLTVAYAIFIGLWYLLNDSFLWLLDSIQLDASKISDNEFYILMLLGCLILLNFFTYQSINRLRIVVPNIIQTLGFKLFLPILVLAYIFLDISETQFAYGIVAFFAVASLLVFIYLRIIDGIKFGKITKPSDDFSYKEMAYYSVFGSLNQLSNGIAFRIDAIMITMILGYAATGAYYLALFISNVIEIPTRSINQISGPIISKAWENNDTAEINNVYKKGSTNLLLIGAFVFLGIWYLIDDIIRLSSNPDSFVDARMIFLFLGIGKLVDMMTSVNSQIIIFSKKYKYNLLFLGLLAISNLSLNYYLIPKYGILGAAIATSISLIIYNIMKMSFIYLVYGMHPFTLSSFKTIFILIPLAFGYYLFPLDWHPIMGILIKGTFVTLIFLPIAYFWKISEDANELLRSTLNKVYSYKK